MSKFDKKVMKFACGLLALGSIGIVVSVVIGRKK